MTKDREVIIHIVRSFEKDGKRYVYGYGAIFDSADDLGTVITKELVQENIPRLKRFPTLRFMHQTPLGRIQFNESIELPDGTIASTRLDDHGFHILGRVFKACEKEWSMLQEGSWGLSYGLRPTKMGKREIGGKSYDSFEEGILYEFSVVDVPAHFDAQVGAIVRAYSKEQTRNNRVIRTVIGTEVVDLEITEKGVIKTSLANLNDAIETLNLEEEHRKEEFPITCSAECPNVQCPYRIPENYGKMCRMQWEQYETPLSSLPKIGER